MPDRLERWIYICMAAKDFDLDDKAGGIIHYKKGDWMQIAESEHPACWSIDGWDEEKTPHPFHTYWDNAEKDKVDIYILDPNSFPVPLDQIMKEARQKYSGNLSLMILDYLDGIEGRSEKWDKDKSTLRFLDTDGDPTNGIQLPKNCKWARQLR